MASLAVVNVVWFVLPGTAVASPGWSMPANYALPVNALSPQIQFASGGTATVAYLELVSQSPLETVLHVGVIPPGGSYQEQLRIASTSLSVPTDVSLAEAPNGAAVVEWATLQGTDVNNSPFAYMASYRPAGGAAWGSPATLVSDSTRVSGISPNIVAAISDDGTAAAGVDHVDSTIASPGGYRIDVATHSPGGSWTPAAHVSPASDSSESLALGFDAGGDLTAAFRLRLSNGRYTLAAERRPATSGIWSSLEDITGSDFTSDAEGPALAVAPDGSAVIAFQYVHYAGPTTLDVNAVTRSGATGGWTTPVDVAPGGASSAPQGAGVSPDDKAYVLYTFQGTSSGLDCVGAVSAPVGGTFTSPRCVSSTNFQSGPRGAVAFLGNDAYFGWSGQPNGGSSSVVEASRWLDGAAQPDSFTDLDAPGASVALDELVPDRDGSVAAFWTDGSTLRAAAFDGGGPNLISAAVPTTAVVGRAVSMGATFADLWSGLGAPPSWSFGDGATASGAQVSHAYSAPGHYTVTITARDGLGNQTTTTYSITVVPPPMLSRVGQSARVWTERHRRGHHQPVGTTFRFTLNEAARVELVFSQSISGRRVSHRCVRLSRRNKHKPPCVLTITVATMTVAGRAGQNKLPFRGGVSAHHKLAPGTYTLTITATTGAGSTSKQLRFTIVGG